MGERSSDADIGRSPEANRAGLNAGSVLPLATHLPSLSALHASPKRQREMAIRAALSDVGTVVVKVGSSSLTTNGRLTDEKIAHVSSQILAASGQGRRVILVSSGAILSGMAHLRLEKRPRTLPMKQA